MTTTEPTCPKCSGPLWDNRTTKRNPKQPDFKCKDKACDGVIWPPRNGDSAPAAPAPAGKQPYSSGPHIPAIDGEHPALPHERLDKLFSVYALIESHVLATSVKKFTDADVGTTPESIAAQIATLFIQACNKGIAAMLLCAALLSGCGVHTSPGMSNKIGQITSMHRVGIMCKTWEAQLQRGGFQNGSGVTGAPFNFTIEDESLVAKTKALMESNTEVEITYRSEGIYAECRTESGGDFLVSIRALHDSVKP